MQTRIFVAASLVFSLAWASTAAAGRIFGDIKMDGKPLPEGVLVTVAPAPPAPPKEGAPKPKPAAAVPPDSTTTDKTGAYKFAVKSEGKCVLMVVYEKEAVSLDVFSYKDPTRYDLVLEKKDGKLALKRR